MSRFFTDGDDDDGDRFADDRDRNLRARNAMHVAAIGAATKYPLWCGSMMNRAVCYVVVVVVFDHLGKLLYI